jgi:hypothetical protein
VELLGASVDGAEQLQVTQGAESSGRCLVGDMSESGERPSSP